MHIMIILMILRILLLLLLMMIITKLLLLLLLLIIMMIYTQAWASLALLGLSTVVLALGRLTPYGLM